MEPHIGCSGWFYPHWKGKFYPNGLPQSKWFKYYAQKFDTVELNSPFYHFPKISTAKSWYRNSPEGFRYSIKVNKAITHIRKFNKTATLIKDFYKLGDELKEKLGCFLFQLPPSLKFNEKKLNQIIKQLDPEKDNVLEFRHISWFTPEVREKLMKNGIIFCTISSPELPEELVKTRDSLYVRFHGKKGWYFSNYGFKELEDWAAKIRKARPRKLWAYFNNDFNANAPRNALALKGILTKINKK